jgi:hypothetical protein
MHSFSPWNTFAGKSVLDFPARDKPDPAEVIYAIKVQGWEDAHTWVDIFQDFLSLPGIEKTTGLVVGSWIQENNFEDPPDPIVEALVAAHQRLPNLEALYFGRIASEEFEISWIRNTDISPLLTAYPKLKRLRVRGANGLSLGGLNHPILTHLSIETGGLPRRLLEEVLNHNLPNLTHLELWLGDPQYGFDFMLDELNPILEAKRFPNLIYLGLRDSVGADLLAKKIVGTPILDQIKVLDLSMGNLGDEGAQALLDSDQVRRLTRLNLSHHYCSDDMMKKLLSLPIEVDLSDQQTEDVYEYNGKTHRARYVAVSE